jgi:hypothetical protein
VRKSISRNLVDVHSAMQASLIDRVHVDVSWVSLCVFTYHCFCGVEGPTSGTECRPNSDSSTKTTRK